MATSKRVEDKLNLLITQYRDSSNLQNLIRIYLEEVEKAYISFTDINESFDIDSATGDALTQIGEWLGFPRTHRVSTGAAFFGFPYDADEEIEHVVAGFGVENSTWQYHGDQPNLTIEEDAIYVKFLKLRIYQLLRRFDRKSLRAALKILWGEDALYYGNRQSVAVVGPGRDFTPLEQKYAELYPRIIPLPFNVFAEIHVGNEPVFGFGVGWAGFCESTTEAANPLTTEFRVEIFTEAGDVIFTGSEEVDGVWLCPTDYIRRR